MITTSEKKYCEEPRFISRERRAISSRLAPEGSAEPADLAEVSGYSETDSGVKHLTGNTVSVRKKEDVYLLPSKHHGVAQVILIVPMLFGLMHKADSADAFGNRMQATLEEEGGHPMVRVQDPKTGTLARLNRDDLTLDIESPMKHMMCSQPGFMKLSTFQEQHETLKPDGEILVRTKEIMQRDVTFMTEHCSVGTAPYMTAHEVGSSRTYENTVIPKGGVPRTELVNEKDGQVVKRESLLSELDKDGNLLVHYADGHQEGYELFIAPSQRKEG